MTPKAITSALAADQALFLPINGQPSDNDLICLSDAILPIFLKAAYNRINSVHNLWGLIASTDCYLHHWCGAGQGGPKYYICNPLLGLIKSNSRTYF
jgi:hypothetical protein